MIPLKGFTPDAPSTAIGTLLDCSSFVPYEAGMRAAFSPSAAADALAAACLGAAALTKLDGSRRVFAGTGTKLYELSGTSWTDVARVGDYTLGATSRWSFTQFGDTSLASNIDTVIQSTTSGDFADLTAPKAAVIESVLSSGGGFVFAFNTIDATHGTSPDRWMCCAVNDVTSWTPAISTQATTGRLLGNEGAITAAKKFGSDRIVAYKANSIYIGSYVGPPTAWAWQEIPDYGCVGLDAVANLGTAHFVVGESNIYIFDGSRPVPIDSKVRTWFLENSSGTYRYRTTVVYDREHDHVWIYFVSAGSSSAVLDRAIVYHLRTQEWGRDNRMIEAAMMFNTPSETFDSDSGTFDDATGPFDSGSPGNRGLAVFDSAHTLSTMDGVPTASSFTLHDIGDDDQVTRLTQATLRYMTQPASSSVSAFYNMATGIGVSSGPMQGSYDSPGDGSNRFPLRQTARWHRLKFNFTGAVEVSGYRVALTPAGKR